MGNRGRMGETGKPGDEEARTSNYKVNKSQGWKYRIGNIVNNILISLYNDRL